MKNLFKKTHNFNKIAREIRYLRRKWDRNNISDWQRNQIDTKLSSLYKLYGQLIYVSIGMIPDNSALTPGKYIIQNNGPATKVYVEETQQFAYVDKNLKLTI